MKLLAKYLRPYAAYLALGLFIKALGTIVELIIPYISSHIIDNVVPKQSVSEILFWGGMMILCSALALLLNVVANRMAAKNSRNVTEQVRRDLFARTMRLSCHSADTFTVPSLESRLTSDTYNLHQMIGMMQRLGIRAPLLLIGGIAVTLVLDWSLAIVMIATLPLLTVIVLAITKRGIPMYTDVQSGVDSMVRIVREDVQGIHVIKALSRKQYERERFDRANAGLTRNEKKVDITMGISRPLMQVCLNLGLVAVVLVGAYRVNSGFSGAGKIIAFLQYFTLISNAMLTLTRIFMTYSKGIASANRIEEILNTEDELPTLADLPVPRRDSHVLFQNVSFAYHKDKNVLHDISFDLSRGQTLGIIGATGSGKSTVIQLLMRFYDVTSGTIAIGGRDIRTIPAHELHRKFGVAMQNDFLFSGTVAENIDFGRGFSREVLRKAAERAQVLDYIDSLPEGFDYMVTSKGTNLSGGQRQRLLIARALAGDPEILILDDSSSALDYKTDLNLRRAIAGIGNDMTVILVAQRVSSILHADRILVLDEGKIIGDGKHEDLLRDCDVYREISDSQMGGAFLE